VLACLIGQFLALHIEAQGLLPGTLSTHSNCEPSELRALHELTFSQRACYYRERLLRRSLALRAVLFSSFDLLRNSPQQRADGLGNLGRRVSIFYATHAAEGTGQLVAGYLHREDPRPHPSEQSGFWRRAKSAMRNVMINQSDDGDRRVALAPIAGAFAAGFTGAACYHRHNRVTEGLVWSGGAYGGNFGVALWNEFRPDIRNFFSRLRDHRNGGAN
jgi:hypothetical protein